MNKRHVCPNGCGANFYTVVHVTQEWKVDSEGNFIDVTDDYIQTIHPPHDDNTWTCTKCGAKAKIEESKK